ncbi:unnamed protein product [Strongylus vulgaris]|uniref:Methylosome subunit pICln n=1 Tax=Strongylus vulgaris TaxID=40348 RepID=A0A3P7L8N7_STRVU|nr:unnamed protein product [Strongylus vulgaris]
MIIMSEVSQPSTGVRLSQPQVVAYMDAHCAGEGTLCVSESQVTWICRSTGLGFSLTYPSIILHAISTDLSTFPQECIYVLVDASKSERRRRRTVPLYTAAEARNVQDLQLAEEELNQNGDISDEDDDEEAKNVVIRFVPSDIREDDEIELSEEGRANLRRMLNQSNNGHGDQGEHEEDQMEEQ